MTALKERPPIEPAVSSAGPEVLIEEARRRQHMRRMSLAGIALLLAAIGIGLGITAGGGSPSGPSPTARGGGSAPQATLSWHELSADGALQAGTRVSAVVSYDGSLVAAGSSDFPTHLPARLGCSISCGTVVWVAQNGGPWRAVFATGQNDGGNALVATRHGLALLSPGIQSFAPGNTEPLHSKAGIGAFLRDQPPAWIAGPASASEGETIYSIGEDDTGLPTLTAPNENSEPAWVSPNGIRWPASYDSQTFKWLSTDKVPGGFVGITQTANRTVVLWSKNDRSWSPAQVSVPNADVAELASGPSGAVLELIPSRVPYRPEPVQFWYTTNGRSWSHATVTGAPPKIIKDGSTLPALISADGGFLAFNRTSAGIWWSKTGRTWTRVHMTEAPPAGLEPQAVGVDGNTLFIAEQGRHQTGRGRAFGPIYQTGPVTFWKARLNAHS
jgi:hypothetical protein